LAETAAVMGKKVELHFIHFMSPGNLPRFQYEWPGLTIALAIFAIWIVALLPRLPVRSIRLQLASVVRTFRKTNTQSQRYHRRVAICYVAIGVAGLALLSIAWIMLPDANIDSLFGALVGVLAGGLLVWPIRIIGERFLGQEAMGFGDVTLMAMIGAFLGWQASLLVFGLAPFFALLIALASFVIRRENELAFGPYLSASTVFVVLSWSTLWPWARVHLFQFIVPLLIALAASLVVFGPLLWLVRRILRPHLSHGRDKQTQTRD
jgi:prepilin signal peptidase PulO-like enzyme (type II secretory pathway)